MATHKQWIDRDNPGCFIFLLDHSTSMNDPWSDPQMEGPSSKADGLAKIVNRALEWLVGNSGGDLDSLYHYFDVAVIGYGATVQSALPGKLGLSSLVTSIELDKAGSTRTENGVSRLVWIEPKANGGTPMAEALELGWRLAEGWSRSHQNCFPPVVFNITDGQATDSEYGDPVEVAGHLRAISTTDGPLTLFNISITGADEQIVKYPSSSSQLRDPWAKQLFEMSSPLPEVMRLRLDLPGLEVGSRAFVMNADVDAALQALEVGTRSAKIDR